MKKKQPKKVQISKQNLTEFLGVLKNFIVEELLETSKKENSRRDRLYKSLVSLEVALISQNSKISSLENQMACGVRTGHCFSVRLIQSYDIVFRCVKCELEYTKSKHKLSRKEKKLLTVTLRG